MRNGGMNYSRKKKSSAPVAFLLILAICLVSFGIVWLTFLSEKENKVNNIPAGADPQTPVSVDDIASQEPQNKEESIVRLVGVGDNLIHTGVYSQAKKRAGGVGYDFNFTYENIAKRIEAADIATVNQETPMALEMEISGYPMFNAPTQVGEQLKKIGFDVVSMGNNHLLDMGEKGLLSSLEFLRGLSPIQYTGAFLNQEDFNAPRTQTVNDISFGFVSATQMTNGLSLPSGSKAIIPLLKNEDLLKTQIQELKKTVDIVVVNAHWGEEYTHVPNDFQKGMAQKLADWGADIIIGHHPHVIQPVEYLVKEDGSHAVVAYSLGNFISTQEFGPRMLGGMLDVTVKKNFETNKTVLDTVKFVPIVTHYEASYANVRNYYLEDYTKALADVHGCHERSQKFGMDYLYDTVKTVVDKQFLEDFLTKDSL